MQIFTKLALVCLPKWKPNYFCYCMPSALFLHATDSTIQISALISENKSNCINLSKNTILLTKGFPCQVNLF